MHIIITGYYKKNNLGDDLFETYAITLFNKFKLKYNKLISTVKLLPINDICLSQNRTYCDRVILFGGEVLNDFFLDRLIELSYLKPSVKFEAIGVSCNQDYSTLINKLQIFEHIIFRSEQDYTKLSKYVSCSYGPDIVFNMTKQISLFKKNNIGFFLSQTALESLNFNQKNKYIGQIINLIRYLIKQNYKILLFPMCTNGLQSEDDNIINSLVYSELNINEKMFVKTYTDNKKVLNKISTLKFAVCYRYHAHILCIINKIPFLSISNTPKVNNLLTENDLSELNDIPINFIDKINYIINNYGNICNKFKRVYKHNHKNIKIYENVDNYLKSKTEHTFYINNKDFELIYNYLCEKFKYYKTNDNEFNTQIIMFFLTKSLINDYSFGLQQKINRGLDKLKNDIYWLINDNILNKNLNFYYAVGEILNKKFNPDGIINITYINQNDYKGLHRSGWQYVIDNLSKFNGSNGLICDMYLDRTFHWNSIEYGKLGVIPYKKNWIGFIHHTCDVDYSIYNTVNLFKNKLFIQSLKYCNGLILLSNDLKNKVDELLNKININVDTYVLYHPTEFINEDRCFTKKKFIMNTSKKIIQIGAWMRNIDAINKLDLGDNKLYLDKYVLKGKKMESYYFDSDTDDDKSIIDTNELLDMCRDKNHKKTKLKQDIKMVNFLENDDYDKLLSENIVFINLYDASAVNTVIECIVRNTPILVNRLNALEEVLGKNYPLFYDNMDDIKEKLNMKLLDDAYDYLQKLDKTKLKIDSFVKSFESIVVNIRNKLSIIDSTNASYC